jgi:ABC-type long-subunit fatty acid transport system fused permease/ATPase subunit
MLLLLFVFYIYYIVIFYLFISTFIYYLNVEKNNWTVTKKNLQQKIPRPYITVRIQIKKNRSEQGQQNLMAASEVPHDWDKKGTLAGLTSNSNSY